MSDERAIGEGVWIWTRPGYVNDAGGHLIHESTVKGCLAAFAEVREWPEDPLADDPAPAVYPEADLNPEGGRVVVNASPGPLNGPFLAGDGISLWSFESEALARKAALNIAAAGCDAYLAGPGEFGPVELPLQPPAADPAPAARPVLLPGEQTPPPAPSHGDAAPTLPELRADAAAGRPVSRSLHPVAEMALMRLAATDQPSLAFERLPLWDRLADAGWIDIVRVGRMEEGAWTECRITDAGRAALDARPSA
ncbi:MAG: hypothetical protein VW779_00665 [Halieaceae bacterium]